MAEEKKQPQKAGKAEKKAKGQAESKKEAKAAVGEQEKGVPPRLFEKYKKEVVPALMKRFSYRNVMQVPRLDKISVNVGVGDATQDMKLLETAVNELIVITGQKPQIRKSKKSISNFKLRENLPIGARVTLRRAHMYEFLDRLVSIALPRVRDFRGLSDKSFDGHGNYSIGVKEQIIFPEIDVDKVTRISGLDITLVTTAKTDLEAYELLRELGLPFVKRQELAR